jgi:hypothetical protein
MSTSVHHHRSFSSQRHDRQQAVHHLPLRAGRRPVYLQERVEGGEDVPPVPNTASRLVRREVTPGQNDVIGPPRLQVEDLSYVDVTMDSRERTEAPGMQTNFSALKSNNQQLHLPLYLITGL